MKKGYAVVFEKNAMEAYFKLDKSIKARIRKSLEKLKGEIATRSLHGHPEIFVLEIGQYRALYLVDEGSWQKIVVFVGDHKEYEKRYRKMF
ncbi:MAG: type II toxin-antitoxin system RelE/ParE family toxin [Candidatus Micrarchaeota archaeon]